MSENKNKNNRIHKIILLVLILMVAVSGIGVLNRYLEDRRAEEEYRRLAEVARQTTEAVTEGPAETEGTVPQPETEPETEAAYVSPIDFEALAKVNPDVIGWIRIPDTNVDYPIVQTDDNDKYLHTSFEGEESVSGAVYLDFESDSDMMGFNNILYGHNMKNGSMFKDIVNYKDQSYFDEHQYFEIYTPERTIRLKAISCYYAKAEPIVRKTRFKTRESYEAFIKEMIKPCPWYETPEFPIDSLYTLVTCSYEVNDARTLLFAVEVDENGEMVKGMEEFQKPEAEGKS